MKKRILGMVLCVCMVLSLITVAAFADEHVYRVAGEPALCDSGWAATDDDNRMTYNGETGRYEKVYTGVRSESYMYKITVDGAWSDDFAEIKTVEVENDNATVTVWYVETTGEWGADVAYDTPAEPPAPSLVRGDIDLDGEVTVKDATMLQDCLENPESLEKLTSEQYEAADFNGDGAVTESDLTALRSFLNPITINGPDVVCAQQDYEFTATASEGVELDDGFGFDTGSKGSGVDLTIDENGVGHGVMLTEWYDLNTNYFDLSVYGYTEDEQLVSGTKRVQVSPEHIYVDGVCGCGAVQQYTVEYIGSGDDPICMDTKTHGEPLTLRGETFTMDGFVQTGWVDGQGAKYDLGAAYTEDRDVTLYPVFEKIVTVTVPFTTTVALGDAGEPGETTFELALIDGRGAALTADNVTAAAAVTTDGAGDYSAAMTITGPERTLWRLLSENAFVRQVNAGEAGWTYDDAVWGLYTSEIAAYSTADSANFIVLAMPASVDGDGYYYIDWESIDWENPEMPEMPEMTFTNTYSAHVYELNHDADGHWDECDCGDIQNKEAHKYGDWKVTKEATEQEAGEKEHTCTVCGYTEKETIPVLEHTHDYAQKHDATSHWDECDCGDIQNKEAHKYGDWKVTKEATETEAGEKEHTCTVCGYTEKAEIAKLAAKPGTDTVLTGDDGFMLWAALFVTSGTLLAVMGVNDKRRRSAR